MNRINETYLDNLIRDLHGEEHAFFSPNSHKTEYPDDKLTKLNQLKVKQISNLKYNAQKLKEIIEKIDHQIKNPKIKAVGI
jgi:hypothetical protein